MNNHPCAVCDRPATLTLHRGGLIRHVCESHRGVWEGAKVIKQTEDGFVDVYDARGKFLATIHESIMNRKAHQ